MTSEKQGDSRLGPEELRPVFQQAVILTAGRGTRMAKRYNGPKHLLPVCGIPILERTLASLPECIENVVLVVGGPYEKEIYNHFKQGTFGRLSLCFVRQSQPRGIAHAFHSAQHYVERSTDKWLGLVGDDLYDPFALAQLAESARHGDLLSILSTKVEDPQNFGVLEINPAGFLRSFEEKPASPKSNNVWCGAMVMDHTFFKIPYLANDRAGISAIINGILGDGHASKWRNIRVIGTDRWLPINDEHQLERAEREVSRGFFD